MLKIQSCGSKTRYSTDATFAHRTKKLSGLDSLPVFDALSAFEEIITFNYYLENKRALPRITGYFEDTNIGKPIRAGRRRASTFPTRIRPNITRNMSDAVVQGSPKTNNL